MGRRPISRVPLSRSEPTSGAGTLFVVATPIGNLEDITLRALKILKTVQLVAAEDTRRTGNLLRHYQIDTPVLSVHEHNERARTSLLVERLRRGDSIALVTDAGTPAVSDPGADLVAAVRLAGLRVEPIPGASAVIAAISAAGIKSDGFTFLGFPPTKANARNNWLAKAVETSKARAVVFFEAPHRMRQTLDELSKLVNYPIILARELTKIHEELLRGTPGDLASAIDLAQGEFTVIIPPQETSETSTQPIEEKDVISLFWQITESGAPESKRGAARSVADRLGLTTKQVYEILERAKLGQ